MSDDWQSRALCAGNLSFGQFPREAVKTCRRCDVINECYATALADRDFEGIAGGLLWQVTNRAATTRKGRRVA